MTAANSGDSTISLMSFTHWAPRSSVSHGDDVLDVLVQLLENNRVGKFQAAGEGVVAVDEGRGRAVERSGKAAQPRGF